MAKNKLKKEIYSLIKRSKYIRQRYLPEKYYAIYFYEEYIQKELYCDVENLRGKYASRIIFNKKCPLAEKKIILMFGKTGVRAERICDEFWEGVLKLPLLKKNEFLKENKFTLEVISSVNSNILSVREWLLIYSFVQSLYLYDIAYILRSLALKRAISDIGKRFFTGSKLVYGCAALIEKNDFDYATSLLSKHNKKLNNDVVSMFNKYINLLSGDRVNKSIDLYADHSDENYYSYIKNKDVALVGPLKETEEIKKEILTFDIKAGFNVRINTNNEVLANKYSGYDVCYYNKATAGNISKNDLLFVPDFVRFANLRSQNHDRVRRLCKKEYSETEFRSFTDYKKIMFNGSFTGVPNALLDLLACKPKKIKIFSSNLHMNWDDYESGYHIENMKLDLKSASNHDLITNFIFMKNAWNNNLFVGDVNLEKVLSMDVKEYINKIQISSLLDY